MHWGGQSNARAHGHFEGIDLGFYFHSNKTESTSLRFSILLFSEILIEILPVLRKRKKLAFYLLI